MHFTKSIAFALLSAAGLATAQIVGTALLSEETPGSETFCSPACVTAGKYIGVSQAFYNDYGCGTIVSLTYGSTTVDAPICFVCAGCIGIPNSGAQPYSWIGSTVVMGDF
ncbi:hypothetical protein BOTBODRAFT_144239, partial [Botryobasidium botryosum FD-172 SS1]